MAASTSFIHVSTLPRREPEQGSTMAVKGTRSPSALAMPVTTTSSGCMRPGSVDVSRVAFTKSMDAMPSKLLFRCGCTRVGSFVSDRISSSSSLDRKKKRGKARRFISRYAFRPFWISSRRVAADSNACAMAEFSTQSMTRG